MNLYIISYSGNLCYINKNNSNNTIAELNKFYSEKIDKSKDNVVASLKYGKKIKLTFFVTMYIIKKVNVIINIFYA